MNKRYKTMSNENSPFNATISGTLDLTDYAIIVIDISSQRRYFGLIPFGPLKEMAIAHCENTQFPNDVFPEVLNLDSLMSWYQAPHDPNNSIKDLQLSPILNPPKVSGDIGLPGVPIIKPGDNVSLSTIQPPSGFVRFTINKGSVRVIPEVTFKFLQDVAFPIPGTGISAAFEFPVQTSSWSSPLNINPSLISGGSGFNYGLTHLFTVATPNTSTESSTNTPQEVPLLFSYGFDLVFGFEDHGTLFHGRIDPLVKITTGGST